VVALGLTLPPAAFRVSPGQALTPCRQQGSLIWRRFNFQLQPNADLQIQVTTGSDSKMEATGFWVL
jgi:hypothetical protein